MVEQHLRAAIEGHRVVKISYSDGLPRILQPHALYQSSSGKLCLDAYQLDGATVSGGPLPDWRTVIIAKITSIALLDEQFDVAASFDLASRKYRHGLLAYVKR